MALNNYLEDDWDDNSLTGRTGAEKDVFYQYSTGGTGDLLKGVYRPRWRTISGSPSVSSGRLDFPNANSSRQELETPSSATTGSWAFDLLVPSLDTGAAFNLVFISEELDSEEIRIRFSTDSEFELVKVTSGSGAVISSVIVDTPTALTEFKVERNAYGDFEIFYSGSSQGTTTDSFLPDVESLILSNRLDISVEADNLIVQ